MDDRTMLELAAKAAGIEAVGWIGDRFTVRDVSRLAADRCPFDWNPLADDGDALRLAVKLRLSITHHNDLSQPNPWVRIEDPQGRWTHVGPSAEFDADPAAGVCRAITRAAAAMAEAKGGRC